MIDRNGLAIPVGILNPTQRGDAALAVLSGLAAMTDRPTVFLLDGSGIKSADVGRYHENIWIELGRHHQVILDGAQ